MSQRTRTPSRRQVLQAALSSGTMLAVGSVARPYISRAADRPELTHGVQSGDISADGGVVWARADRASRLIVEASTTESFKEIAARGFVDALPESDFTGKLALEGLPADQHIFYRVTSQSLAEPMIIGPSVTGRFRTAPGAKRSVSFLWSGDTCGQGWGIDEARGGMKTYATMLRHRPDFFLHNGDTIYADGVISAEQKNAERRNLEEHRHRGEIQACRNARRVSRQLQIQSPRRQCPRLQRRSTDTGAVGRS